MAFQSSVWLPFVVGSAQKSAEELVDTFLSRKSKIMQVEQIS
jgi:hypothetical protein